MPSPIPIPVEDLMKYEDCAWDAKVSVATISNWANAPRRSLRLPVVNLGHRTKRVRRSDWQAFKHDRLNPLNQK